jgi:flagellar motor switch protein FliN/FliY
MSQPEQTIEGISHPAEGSGTGIFGNRPAASSTAPLLMGVKLPIRVLVGRARLPLRDIVRLGSGSVVELDCSPDDPVEIIVNDRVIARGEIVVVDGNYGVRVTKIESQGQASGPHQPVNDLVVLSERLK